MSVKCIPHIYIAKLVYAGVYLFFLFLFQNIDCGYLLVPPSFCVPTIICLSKYIKNIKICPMKFSTFTSKKFSVRCFILNVEERQRL